MCDVVGLSGKTLLLLLLFFFLMIRRPPRSTQSRSSAASDVYKRQADQFVVTSDSMSMVAEASFTAKPLYLFSLDDGADWWRRSYNYRFKPLTHRLAMAIGPQRMRRNVDTILQHLLDTRTPASPGQRWPGHPSHVLADPAQRSVLAAATPPLPP